MTDNPQVGELVKDWRRVNVSITRARSKLIIFGSRSTLQSAPLLSEFFTLMEDHKWLYRLPANAHQMHDALLQHRARKRAASEALSENPIPNPHLEITSFDTTAKKARLDRGVVKGRHILNDLVNGI
jgi:DNA replication ATP-dependent helicase Dna2